jgi:hypothetical protein
MKNKNLVHAHESAKIYKAHYRPSLNVIRLFKGILMVFVSGSSAASASYRRRRIF